MSVCASPLSFAVLVAYWAGDLDTAESDAIDEHVFSCATCTEASARVAAITERLRASVPPFVSASHVARLRERGLRIEDHFLKPGERRKVVFDEQDLLIHHLGGLDLTTAERVATSVLVAETGELLATNPEVPFDREAGEVLVACQRHFAAYPPNIRLEVTATDRDGRVRSERYTVDHEYAWLSPRR